MEGQMAERKRARTKAGKFIPDDPNTPEIEKGIRYWYESTNTF